jgi:hypothetical protein
MRSILLLLFAIAIIFITIGYTESRNNCPLPKIEYRYVPRSFYEEQVSGNDVVKLYSDMFNEQDLWATYPRDFIENNAALTGKQLRSFITESKTV